MFIFASKSIFFIWNFIQKQCSILYDIHLSKDKSIWNLQIDSSERFVHIYVICTKFEIQDILLQAYQRKFIRLQNRKAPPLYYDLLPISDSSIILMSSTGNNGRVREKPQICFVLRARFSPVISSWQRTAEKRTIW